MVSEKEEKELEDKLTDFIGELRSMGYSSPEKRGTAEWNEKEKELKDTWHKLIAIDPVYRYYGQEISETLHPEYFF